MRNSEINENEVCRNMPGLNDVILLLKILKNYSAPMGALLLFMSILALNIYTNNEKIPISILSPDVVSGLPILFGLICVSVAAIIAMIAGSSNFLLHREQKLDHSLIEAIDAAGERAGYSIARTRLSLIAWWVFGFSVIGLLYYYLLSGDRLGPLSGTLLEIFIIVSAIFLLEIIVAVVLGKYRNEIYKISFLFVSFISAITQTFILMLLSWLSVNNLGQFIEEEQWVIASIAAVYAMVQLGYVGAMSKISRMPDRVIRLSVGAFIIMLFVCLLVPLNQYFVGYALSSSAMGVRKCVKLMFVHNANILPEIVDHQNKLHSIYLQIPLSTQSIIYARPFKNSSKTEIILIPYSQVAKVMDCNTKSG